jgi:ATP-dependent Clp protease ATP-binding subunit ClpB
LLNILFADESMMTRIDLSEYQEKHTVKVPPWWVALPVTMGYDDGGQVTESGHGA